MSHMFTISYPKTQVYPCGLGVCGASRAAAVPNKAHPHRTRPRHPRVPPTQRGAETAAFQGPDLAPALNGSLGFRYKA